MASQGVTVFAPPMAAGMFILRRIILRRIIQFFGGDTGKIQEVPASARVALRTSDD